MWKTLTEGQIKKNVIIISGEGLTRDSLKYGPAWRMQNMTYS